MAIIRGLKLVAYILVFGVMAVGTVLSIALTLLMTSMVQTNRTMSICTRAANTHPPIPDPDEKFVLQYNDTDRVAWIWSLFFATITPYLLTFGRALRICIFKKFSIPSLSTIIIVSFYSY